MSRKTVSVDMIKAQCNLIFRTNQMSPAYRQGISELVSNILMDTGNYRGFRYLHQDEVPEDELPGIYPSDNYDKRFEGTDPTRIQYY